MTRDQVLSQMYMSSQMQDHASIISETAWLLWPNMKDRCPLALSVHESVSVCARVSLSLIFVIILLFTRYMKVGTKKRGTP